MPFGNSRAWYVSPWLSGQWVDGQLYLIDVKASRHYLVGGAVGFLIASANKGLTEAQSQAEAAALDLPDVTPQHIQELLAAGILTTTKPEAKMRPEIEAIDGERISKAKIGPAILESGDIAMRLVASATMSMTMA